MVDSPVNPLSKLKLDSWYMVLIPIGAIILIFSVFVSNKEWFLFGAGLMLIGLGEWKNQKFVTELREANYQFPAMKLTIPIRKPDVLGCLLDILGVIALIIWGLGFFDIIHIV